jgi:lauroyl/myristoyl acyltransferase
VEKLVRQRPDQYQWGYKRFRTRPEGVAKLY